MDEKDNKDKRSLVMAEIMPPEKENFGGHIHGGFILDKLDRVAYACATKYCGNYCVTVSVDEVTFKEPIQVGELVTFLASVDYVGNTSLEVGIRVEAENLLTGETRHTNTCFFTFVALDKNKRPTKITPLTLRNPEEKGRFKESQLRKDLRKKFNDEHQRLKTELKKKETD